MKQIYFIIATLFLFVAGNVNAKTAADYAKFYDIDLDEKLPSLEELEKNFIDQYSNYDRRYPYKSAIGNVFDTIFRDTITYYGSSEARIKDQIEESLMDMLKHIPKSYYQYVGPYIHEAYGMPEKIKNMPGIKETKNKFPTRIAPQLADVENIDFLSPALYFLLIPEIWPTNVQHLEYYPKKVDKMYVTTKWPDNFMQKVNDIVHPEQFYEQYADKEVNQSQISDLRTINPTKTSPLTSGDIKAFAKTISSVNDFGRENNNFQLINSVGLYLDIYEEKQGKALPINRLKDIVNPCQRLVQKIRLAGLETKFKVLLAKDGFDIKGWAYTCDKTIKAYRKSQMDTYKMKGVVDFKNKTYESYIKKSVSYKSAEAQFATMQGVVEMYSAPLHDWQEAAKNAQLLEEEFKKAGFMIINQPISQ